MSKENKAATAEALDFKFRCIEPVMSKGIYTQEMCNKGVLPSVGMECLIKDKTYDNIYHAGFISFVGISNTVWTSGGDEYSQSNIQLKFKPLTPPITLINGEIYEFELSFGDFRVGYYVEDRNSFFDGMLSSNKICGKGEATNIELLTVK